MIDVCSIMYQNIRWAMMARRTGSDKKMVYYRHGNAGYRKLGFAAHSKRRLGMLGIYLPQTQLHQHQYLQFDWSHAGIPAIRWPAQTAWDPGDE